jgi:hypothetical protein
VSSEKIIAIDGIAYTGFWDKPYFTIRAITKSDFEILRDNIADNRVVPVNLGSENFISRVYIDRAENSPDNFTVRLKVSEPLPPVVIGSAPGPRNKYQREIKPGVWVDVYDVLQAFNVRCPAMAHGIKKCLAPGQRGVKDSVQDKNEAIVSIKRSIEMEQEGRTNE